MSNSDSYTKLPTRRQSRTIRVVHTWPGQRESEFDVTYGFDDRGILKECFCHMTKSGNDMQVMINDACIAISRDLQRGDTIADLAEAFSEDRQEGEKSGPPSSPYGTIARVGVQVQDDFVFDIAALAYLAHGAA